MADSNGNGASTVRLSWPVTLQLIAVLVAIGIAWGNLSTKQTSMEQSQSGMALQNAEIIHKLETVQERLGALEWAVNHQQRR
jgi:hypothetical protein